MLCVGALLLQDVFWVFHQGGIEKSEAEVVSEGADDRDVAVFVGVAGMTPFNGFCEYAGPAYATQICEA